MLTEAVITTITEAAFSYLLEQAGLAEKARLWLHRDPQRLAFQVALTRAYTSFAHTHQEWVAALFDEHFLNIRAAPLLAQCLTRAGPPDAAELAAAWVDGMGIEGDARARQISAFTPVGADFLSELEKELRCRSEFQFLFDSRAIDSVAVAAAESAQTLRALQEEFSRALAEMAATFQVSVAGSVQGLVVGDQATVTNIFHTFAEAAMPLSRYIRIKDFQALVDERTKRFVGREFVFHALDRALEDPTSPSGYMLIRGEPGIGKTAMMCQLVKQRGYVHHFNIAPQNIRSAQSFLANVCAQLIVRYGLGYPTLPPEATKDSGFLSQLLVEAVAKAGARPVVVLVDALDEAEDIVENAEANRLYLPHVLPEGVFFIVTTREQIDYKLFVAQASDIYLRDNDLDNLRDVSLYIHNFIQEHHERMTPRIAQWGINQDEFIEILTEKSQGNFMYLVHVLRDIGVGLLTRETLDHIRNLPRGLRVYYERHWRAMRARNPEDFEQFYEPIVCTLAVAREPVTIAQLIEWTGRLVQVRLTPMRVREVIRAWREFLNVDQTDRGESLYRIYHASFRDFLQEEVGLVGFENTIAQTALEKIPGFNTPH